jgi:hypothetical protein
MQTGNKSPKKQIGRITMETLPFHHRKTLDNGVTIAVNSPPEVLKRLMPAKLPNADILLCGDTATHNDISLMNTEFPVLHRMFVEERGRTAEGKPINGQWDWATGRMLKPQYLVGDRDRVDAHMKALRMAVTGPTRAEYKMLNVNAHLSSMLLRETKDFAIKRKGEIVPVEEFLRPVYFDEDGVATIPELGVTIRHTDKDAYSVSSGCQKYAIQLTAEGDLSPSWPLPQLRAIEVTHEFAMYAVGCDSGFGGGPTTCYLFEFGGEYVLWDCPAYVSRTLMHNGIMPGQVKKIFISHVHDDHANDLLPFALNSMRKVEILATREVMYSLKVKLSALWNKPIERIDKYFRWRVISVGDLIDPISLYGYQFKPFYGLHPIPSIGVTVSHEGKHVLTISGDTGLEFVLKAKLENKTINQQRYDQISSLLRNEPCFVDAGEASIHGILPDLMQFDTSQIHTYHRGSLPAEYLKKVNLVKPGNIYAVRTGDSRSYDAATISTTLQNLPHGRHGTASLARSGRHAQGQQSCGLCLLHCSRHRRGRHRPDGSNYAWQE